MALRPFLLAVILAASAVSAGVARGQETTDSAPPSDGSRDGLLPEPAVVARAVAEVDRRRARRNPTEDGLFVVVGNMLPGSGWIAAGPGYRRHVMGGRATVTTSTAVSWRLYSMAQASVDVPVGHRPISAGGQVLYRDSLQVNFFGVGNESRLADRSGYRLRTAEVSGYGSARWRRFTVQGRIGGLPYVEISSMQGRETAYPNTEATFTEARAPGLTHQPAYLHGDASIQFDTRDDAGRPTKGGLYGASIARYVDLDGHQNSFLRYEAEVVQFFPLASDWIIGLRAWGAFADPDKGSVVPFYLMPSIGGKSTLRGFGDFRFIDRAATVVSAESQWRIWAHLDAAVFADMGRVAARPSDLGLSHLKTSYGAGVRLHNQRTMLARLDVAHSVEGWYLVFRFSPSLKRTTAAGDRTPVIPFVP